MGGRSKTNKQRTLGRIAVSAARFNPDFQGCFLCPVCLGITSLGHQSKITQAHIVPKSAGGNITTFLCARCNSTSGHRQDVWFGEYLYLLQEDRLLIETRRPAKRISINGVSVPAAISRTESSIDVIVRYDGISPAAADALSAAVDAPRLEISTQVPILERDHDISVGFLTAAYLLWFRELGYSWVLQSHLDPVRRKIRNPHDEADLRGCSIVAVDRIFTEPWVGFAEIGNNAYPVCGIGDRLVIFPSWTSSLGSSSHDVEDLTYERVRFFGDHGFSEPTGVIYRDELLVCPDFPPLTVARYAGDGQLPQVLHRTYGDVKPGGESEPKKLRFIRKDLQS